jgi:hypothetical protein
MTDLNVQVIDNFLDNDEYKKICDIFMADEFPWFFNNFKVDFDDNEFQFTHTLYWNKTIWSNSFQNLQNLIERINPISIIRIKLNLTTKTDIIKKYRLHPDEDDLRAMTMIYYLNTNNGYTYFEDGQIIESVQNRAVFFPSHILHSGTSCSDQKIRVVLNMTYFERQK